MRTEEDKSAVELQVFLEFSGKVDLPLLDDTAKKRLPPEPDILCEHETEGPIAFELVEICDPNLARIETQVRKGVVQEDALLWTSDPSALILCKKLKKSEEYEITHPIELLCYTNGRVVSPDNLIIPTILPLLGSTRHTFRRVWLLGRQDVYLVWEKNHSHNHNQQRA